MRTGDLGIVYVDELPRSTTSNDLPILDDHHRFSDYVEIAAQMLDEGSDPTISFRPGHSEQPNAPLEPGDHPSHQGNYLDTQGWIGLDLTPLSGHSFKHQ